MLDMHTSLQVHPFVPRTFILQMMKTPFPNKPGVGIYVGEAAGEWNLGRPSRLNMMTETEKVTLTYHVLQCLLRAQILAFRILGFTMKCIQPARIWRWRTGFRLDFIGCLVDSMYLRNNNDPVWGGKEALATIYKTLDRLGLITYLPIIVKNILLENHQSIWERYKRMGHSYSQTQTQSYPDDGYLLHDVYNMCTGQNTSVESDLVTILGPDQYVTVTLRTIGATVEPYGPFYIQPHNQCFRWDKVIVVEPVLNGLPRLAMMFRDPNRHSVGTKHKD